MAHPHRPTRPRARWFGAHESLSPSVITRVMRETQFVGQMKERQPEKSALGRLAQPRILFRPLGSVRSLKPVEPATTFFFFLDCRRIIGRGLLHIPRVLVGGRRFGCVLRRKLLGLGVRVERRIVSGGRLFPEKHGGGGAVGGSLGGPVSVRREGLAYGRRRVLGRRQSTPGSSPLPPCFP